MEETNYRVEEKPYASQNNNPVDMWKLARLGYLLSKIRHNLNFNQLILLMYLSYFKYADIGFLDSEFVIGDKSSVFMKKELGVLIKIGLVEKVDLNTEKIGDELPSVVYRNTSSGTKLCADLMASLDGHNDFFSFEY